MYTKLILDHSSVDVLSNEMHAHHVYTKLILDHSSVDVLSNEMHAHHVYMKTNNCFWNIRVLISQPITCISHHVVHATSRNWFWNIHVLIYQPMKSTLFFYTTCMGSISQLKQLVSTKKIIVNRLLTLDRYDTRFKSTQENSIPSSIPTLLMATPVKRKLEFDVSEIQDTHNHATIHGVIGCLSPIKTSKKDATKKYFNAAISDGIQTVRMVSFDPALRPKLEKIMNEESSPVGIVNCIVKKSIFLSAGNSTDDPTFELLLNNHSKVVPSPLKKFRLTSENFELLSNSPATSTSTTVTISELHLLAVNERVTLRSVKVVDVSKVDQVTTREGKYLKKQECVIADENSTCRIVLWEADIDRLSLNSSYRLEHVTTRSFNDTKYLSVSSSTNIQPIDDIASVTLPAEETYDGEIIAVTSTMHYHHCIVCDGKIKDTTHIIGFCSKCGLQVKLKKCGNLHRQANVKILKSSTNHIKDATFAEEELKKLVPSTTEDDTLAQELLSIEQIHVSVNHKNIVIAVNFSYFFLNNNYHSCCVSLL